MLAEGRSARTPSKRRKTHGAAPFVALACGLATATAAEASPELAKRKNCASCHAVERKIVGPSWRDVAARYRGRGDAVAVLVPKVRHGGAGAWGAVPMPANPQVDDADARRLVQWILSLP